MELPAIEPLDEHNREWVANVRPDRYRNPTPPGRYNLLVIGAGPAGLVAAAGAAGLGARVALVEKNLMGGDCSNVGCVPSKALIRAARAAAEVHRAGEFGVHIAGSVHLDFGRAMERMRRLRARISHHDSVKRFSDLGIDVYLGSGEFIGPDAFEIDGRRLQFSRACIATGARAVELPIPGLAEAGALTNETVFSLTELPPRLAVIGGGPIGCELAQAFARFGSQVTLLEAGRQLLPKDDREAAEIVEAALRRDGVQVNCCSEAKAVRVEGRDKIIQLESLNGGGRSELRVDAILLAVGRAPNAEGLGLERANVEYDARRGIQVDDHLRTTNPQVFAAGDVCSAFRFTHSADAMARIVLANALFFGRKKTSALTIPWCTYTEPEVAHVGLTAEEAAGHGDDVREIRVDLSSVDRAILDGEEDGFLKIHADKSGRILGATVVANHAGDLIGALSMAITNGIKLGDIAGTIFPYPTQAEVIKKAGDAWNRTKLTPAVKKAFESLLKLRR